MVLYIKVGENFWPPSRTRRGKEWRGRPPLRPARSAAWPNLLFVSVSKLGGGRVLSFFFSARLVGLCRVLLGWAAADINLALCVKA